MKIAGAHQVSAAPAAAYTLLQDPAILAKCMPGCEGLDRIAENEYAMRMKVAMASVSGLFDGKVSLADLNPPVGYRLIVEGAGKIGFLRGEGVLTLSEHEAGTNVAYEGDVQVGGTIASVGQRLLDVTAKMLIKRFFQKLCAESGNAASETADQ
jgi:uncharacterized protein